MRLLVADETHDRVLLWNTFPTTNGQPADVVIGQPTLAGGTAVVTASGMSAPLAVASNGTQIAVADNPSSRVLVWNSFPTQNGAPADVVLGQADFTSDVAACSATGMNRPTSVLFHEDMLLVGDSSNSRVLVFR